MDGHHNPNNPQNSAITEVITDLHDALCQLITSPVGTVLTIRGMRMEVLPGPVYQITDKDGQTLDFRRG